MSGNSLFRIEFNGHPMRAAFVDGLFVIFARDLGAALGYSDGGGRLVENIRGRWSDEVRSGHETVVVAPSGFNPTDSVGLSNNGHLALTKEGVFMVLSLARQPAGVAFRRWWVHGAMPVLEKVAAGKPIGDAERKLLGVGAAAVLGVTPEESVPKLNEGRKREVRAKVDGLSTNQHRIALNQALKSEAITRDEYNERMRALLEFDGKGEAPAPAPSQPEAAKMLQNPPVPANHHRAKAIGSLLGISDRKVHDLARKLNLRNERYCYTRHETRETPVYHYNDEAIAELRAELARSDGEVSNEV